MKMKICCIWTVVYYNCAHVSKAHNSRAAMQAHKVLLCVQFCFSAESTQITFRIQNMALKNLGHSIISKRSTFMVSNLPE